MDLGWFLDQLRKQTDMIKAAPVPFAFAVILVFIIALIVVRAFYQERLDQYRDLMTLYKEKSSVSTLSPDQVQSLKDAWAKAKKTLVRGKAFTNEEVLLDGYAYEDCTFNNVTFVFNGDAPFDLIHNTINGAVLKTNNPAISGFVRLLREFGWIKPGIKWYGD